MKLLIDEDSLGTTLLVRLQTMGHEIIRLPVGTQDDVVFAEAQRLAIPILTANVGRKGRRDPIGLYGLAKERIPHHGVIGIFRPAPTHQLANQQIVEAIDRLAAQEQQQPGTALRKDDLTRLNDFLSILD